MGKVTIKAPVTMHDGRQYVAPGSNITLDEVEARKVIALHGEYGGHPGIKGDPANTQALNVLDETSIQNLNTHAEINGGHGLDAPSSASAPTMHTRRLSGARVTPEDDSFGRSGSGGDELDPLPSDADLEAMKKDELLDLAHERGVSVAGGDSKAEIIAKLKAAK